MITRRTINSALKQYKELRIENPMLTSEEAQAVLLAASNDAIAQALYSIESDITVRVTTNETLPSMCLIEAQKQFDELKG